MRTRVEVKLLPEVMKQLDFCIDKLDVKKTEIIKQGINEIYLMVHEMYSEAYKESYMENFSEIYDFKLDEGYGSIGAEEAAKEFAEYAAVEDATAAVKTLLDL